MRELLERWVIVKHELQVAQNELLMIENQLLEWVELKEEGSKTYKQDGYKMTITTRVNRSFDEKTWDNVKGQIQEDLWPVKTKTVLDETGWKYLKGMVPEVAKIASQAITEKPGKPGFKIEKE